MPLPAERFPFTARLIALAPLEAGVYVLWHGEDLIYIGHAKGGRATLRACLLDHFSGVSGPCTRRANFYGWELSEDPEGDEARLLVEYRSLNQRLPRCNARA
ncbi:MAG: hypothetical protein JO035_16700 [Betaproteobacteria bacterium]|nr:hypothetical protein [Betaproteobacteria bacterium]